MTLEALAITAFILSALSVTAIACIYFDYIRVTCKAIDDLYDLAEESVESDSEILEKLRNLKERK